MPWHNKSQGAYLKESEEAYDNAMNTVRRIKRQYNESIDIEGVLLTMYDGRLNLTQQVVAEVKRFFPYPMAWLKIFIPTLLRG